MHRRKLLESAIALGGSALVCTIAPAASARSTSRLFVIARSKNANIVSYDERDDAGAFRARLQIGNRPAFLRRVFVDTSERGVLPSVNYVELHGSDATRSSPVSERLAP
jgi:hypothetical protein